MDSQTHKNLSELINFLEDTASSVRVLEAEAQEALQNHDDVETYKEKLSEKTLLLMELPEWTGAFLDNMEEGLSREIRTSMEDFARRAGQAMDLSSPFYMSALLYPDNYKEGERNDLENYIEHLRKRFLR